jgi:RNA polymerase sigma-70 factor, ECF subfamily
MPAARVAVSSRPLPQCDSAESFVRFLHGHYGRPLHAAVTRLTGGDRHWAEDVVQETMLRAWRHADRLRRDKRAGNPMPWLVTVARRIIINQWQARQCRPPEADDTALAHAAVPDDTERVLQRLVLAEALSQLSPIHRRAVVEVFLRGRTVRETARIVGVPPGTVKSRVFNALRVMRGVLSGRHGDDAARDGRVGGSASAAMRGRPARKAGPGGRPPPAGHRQAA